MVKDGYNKNNNKIDGYEKRHQCLNIILSFTLLYHIIATIFVIIIFFVLKFFKKQIINNKVPHI